MSSQHTSESWRVETQHVGPHRMRYRIVTASGSLIVAWVGDYDDEAKANLIAIAPDLLALVRSLKTILGMEDALRPGYGWRELVDTDIVPLLAKIDGGGQ